MKSQTLYEITTAEQLTRHPDFERIITGLELLAESTCEAFKAKYSKPSLSYGYSWETTLPKFSVELYANGADPDLLKQSCFTSVASIESLRYYETGDITLDGYIFNFTICISGPLPEDDLLTLRMLGKVQTHVTAHKPSVYESVTCEI